MYWVPLAKISNNSLFYCCCKGRPAGRPARQPVGRGVEASLNISLGACAFGFLGTDASARLVHVRAGGAPEEPCRASSHSQQRSQLLQMPGISRVPTKVGCEHQWWARCLLTCCCAHGREDSLMRFFISSIFLGFLRKGTKVHLENAGGGKKCS